MNHNRQIPWTVQWGFPFLSGNLHAQTLEMVRTEDRLILRSRRLWQGLHILAGSTLGLAGPLLAALSWQEARERPVQVTLLVVASAFCWLWLYHLVVRPRRIEIPYATGDIELYNHPGPEPFLRLEAGNILAFEIRGIALLVETREGERLNLLGNPRGGFVEEVRQALVEMHTRRSG